MTTPFIDVVLPTRNRANLLRRALESLLEQQYPVERFAIIIVDDGSTDETWNLLQNAGDARVRPLRIEHRGPYTARNEGWRAGSGDIVAFIDDDCVANPNWLSAIAQGFARSEVLGLQGRTLTLPALQTPLTHQVVVSSLNTRYETCNIAYRRDILTSVGGFAPDLYYTADTLLGVAVSALGTIAFAPDMIVIHPPRPRHFLGRQEWTRWLTGAWLLHSRYPEFFRRERASHFLLLVLWRWGLLVPAKNILENTPWILRNPRLFLKFLFCLAQERVSLLAAVPGFWRKSRSA
ncbi:MAG TPA: glycosyltransferase family A protein [Candidatus Binatia bacterium]|nr:glycosyltransferase family A protein [Candidatus Binatia bacterium]